MLTQSTSSRCISQTNQDRGDRLFARRRELVASATQSMAADEVYDGEPWVDPSQEEPMQKLETFAADDMEQTSDEADE